MPTEPKPPYKLTIKLDGAKPERIMEALTELREKMSEHDTTGEAAATMTIEGWQEAPLRAVLDSFETWLFYHGAAVESEVTFKRPGVRPETIAMLSREKGKTPMDAAGWQPKPGSTTTVRLGPEHYDALEKAGKALRKMGSDDESDLFPGQPTSVGEKALNWLEAREQD